MKITSHALSISEERIRDKCGRITYNNIKKEKTEN